MGVLLRVKNSMGGDTSEYFFEVKFPPEQWRHLCLQYDGGSGKVNVLMDDSFFKAGQRTYVIHGVNLSKDKHLKERTKELSYDHQTVE